LTSSSTYEYISLHYDSISVTSIQISVTSLYASVLHHFFDANTTLPYAVSAVGYKWWSHSSLQISMTFDGAPVGCVQNTGVDICMSLSLCQGARTCRMTIDGSQLSSRLRDCVVGLYCDHKWLMA